MHYKKTAFTLILMFTTYLSTYSQILNIERYKIEKDTTKAYTLKTTAGLNIFNRSAAADSPVDLFGYNININGLYYPDKHAFIFVSKFDYLRINEDDFLNFGFVHGRINFNRDEDINYDVYSQYSYDNFRGLHPRLIAGGSIRKNLIKNNNISFVLGIGGFFEHEEWDHPIDGNQIEVNLIKNSNYLSFRMSVNDYLDINTMNYYQVGYDDAINTFRHRVSSITNINTKISERFSLTNSFEINYEDRPIVPITKLIFAIRTGISLDL